MLMRKTEIKTKPRASSGNVACIASSERRRARGPGSDSDQEVGLRQGTLVALTPDGYVWVSLELERRRPYCLKALANVQLSRGDLGGEVSVWEAPDELGVVLGKRVLPDLSVCASVDKQARVVISAAEEIVLECGEASITMRRNGRVVIKGAHVETRSKGMNRLKGATVQIN